MVVILHAIEDARAARRLAARLRKFALSRKLRRDMAMPKMPFRDVRIAAISGAVSADALKGVIVCSPNLARSAAFDGLSPHDLSELVPVIVAGQPSANAPPQLRCFPPVLAKSVDERGVLAIDLQKDADGWHDGLLKLAGRLLGISFGALKDREAVRQSRQIRTFAGLAVGLTLMIALSGALYWEALYASDASLSAWIVVMGFLHYEASDMGEFAGVPGPASPASLAAMKRTDTALDQMVALSAANSGIEGTARLVAAHAHIELANIMRLRGEYDASLRESALAVSDVSSPQFNAELIGGKPIEWRMTVMDLAAQGLALSGDFGGAAKAYEANAALAITFAKGEPGWTDYPSFAAVSLVSALSSEEQARVNEMNLHGVRAAQNPLDPMLDALAGRIDRLLALMPKGGNCTPTIVISYVAGEPRDCRIQRLAITANLDMVRMNIASARQATRRILRQAPPPESDVADAVARADRSVAAFTATGYAIPDLARDFTRAKRTFASVGSDPHALLEGLKQQAEIDRQWARDNPDNTTALSQPVSTLGTLALQQAQMHDTQYPAALSEAEDIIRRLGRLDPANKRLASALGDFLFAKANVLAFAGVCDAARGARAEGVATYEKIIAQERHSLGWQRALEGGRQGHPCRPGTWAGPALGEGSRP